MPYDDGTNASNDLNGFYGDATPEHYSDLFLPFIYLGEMHYYNGKVSSASSSDDSTIFITIDNILAEFDKISVHVQSLLTNSGGTIGDDNQVLFVSGNAPAMENMTKTDKLSHAQSLGYQGSVKTTENPKNLAKTEKLSLSLSSPFVVPTENPENLATMEKLSAGPSPQFVLTTTSPENMATKKFPLGYCDLAHPEDLAKTENLSQSFFTSGNKI